MGDQPSAFLFERYMDFAVDFVGAAQTALWAASQVKINGVSLYQLGVAYVFIRLFFIVWRFLVVNIAALRQSYDEDGDE